VTEIFGTLVQGRRSRFTVTGQKILFRYGCISRRGVFLVVCRVVCAKVIGATSSEGFLVLCCCQSVRFFADKNFICYLSRQRSRDGLRIRLYYFDLLRICTTCTTNPQQIEIIAYDAPFLQLSPQSGILLNLTFGLLLQWPLSKSNPASRPHCSLPPVVHIARFTAKQRLRFARDIRRCINLYCVIYFTVL